MKRVIPRFRAILTSGFPLPVALFCALLLISPGRPSAEIVLSVPDYTWADLGTEFMLPIRASQIVDSNAVNTFSIAVYIPTDIAVVDTVPVPGEIVLSSLSATKRDSANLRIVNVTGSRSPITGQGVLFYLRCTAKQAMPNTALRNTIRTVRLFSVRATTTYSPVLNAGEPGCRLAAGNLLIRNSVVPVVLTTGMDSTVTMGTTLKIPVRISAIWPWDSLSRFDVSVALPTDVLVENAVAEKGALSLTGIASRVEAGRLVVSGSGSYVVGEGVLFYVRCTARTVLPDTTKRNTVREVSLMPSGGIGTYPDYLNNGTIPCSVSNGSVCVRNPSADPIVLSVPADTTITAGQEMLLPVRLSTVLSAPDRWDDITSFNFGVAFPLDVLDVDTTAVKGPVFPAGGGFSSARRDSMVVVGGYWTSSLLNRGVLFYIRCRVKPQIADGTTREIRLERLLQVQGENRNLLFYLNERGKPTCVVQNGIVRVSNPAPTPVVVSLPTILQAYVGQNAFLPIHVDRLTVGDSVTTVNMCIQMPVKAVSGGATAFAGELLPPGTSLETQMQDGEVTVSCVAPYPVSGSGELFTLQVTAAPDCPDSLSGPVLIEKVVRDGIVLDYLVKSKRAVNVQNGTVLVRNFNLIPVALAASSDTSAVAGSPLSVAVEADGLISSSGTTAFQFSLSIPPALFPSPTFAAGLLSAESVTRVDSAAGLFRVSGSVANPTGGSGSLFTIQGTPSTDITDGILFDVVIGRLIEATIPLPIVEKNGQHPDCSLSNGVIKVRNSVSVAQFGVVLPSPAELLAYPNPFNAVITFRRQRSAGNDPFEATIYSVLGTVVRRWVLTGEQWTWDGCDDHGTRAASGTYVLIVHDGTSVSKKRVTLLR